MLKWNIQPLLWFINQAREILICNLPSSLLQTGSLSWVWFCINYCLFALYNWNRSQHWIRLSTFHLFCLILIVRVNSKWKYLLVWLANFQIDKFLWFLDQRFVHISFTCQVSNFFPLTRNEFKITTNLNYNFQKPKDRVKKQREKMRVKINTDKDNTKTSISFYLVTLTHLKSRINYLSYSLFLSDAEKK